MSQSIYAGDAGNVSAFPSGADLSLEIRLVGFDALEIVESLNERIFREQRIINQFDRADLVMMLALDGDDPVGFKVGYGESAAVFYSAKGGVLQEYRRRGIARAMLHAMMEQARTSGYSRFAFDTFPNLHAGMTVLGLAEGFRVIAADFNTVYRDYRLRLQKELI
jgi:GNAT superfamily N-acetyltransferase